MDDSKIYRVDDNTNTNILDIIEKKFGELVRTTGKKYTFFGTDIEFIGNQKLAITTPINIEEAIEYFKEEAEKCIKTCKKNLFSVHTKSQPLDHEKVELFHSIIEKLLRIMKKSIPDLNK